MDYTKAFIEEQKKNLLQEKESIQSQIATLKSGDPFMDPDHASDNAAIDTDVREQIGHDTVEAEIKDFKRRLELIDIALAKIDKNEYGYCERCHGKIPMERLKFIPEARYDIDCEKQLVK